MRLRDFSYIYAIYAFMMQFVYVFKVLGLGVCFFCHYCRVLTEPVGQAAEMYGVYEFMCC